jgi:hypothetical protein
MPFVAFCFFELCLCNRMAFVGCVHRACLVRQEHHQAACGHNHTGCDHRKEDAVHTDVYKRTNTKAEQNCSLLQRIDRLEHLVRYRRRISASPCNLFTSRDSMASYDHFRQELRAQMGRATERGAIDMLVTSGELFDALPKGIRPDLGIGFCCDAMRDEMVSGDVVLLERENGSGMTVRFMLPRVHLVPRRPLFG